MEQIDVYRACATLLNAQDKSSLEARLALKVLAIAARSGELQTAMRGLSAGAPRELALR
ncbi:MAG TPA: hypothetical protein V6D47_17870 [Oscillatoriaceae cyanobacterium]